jgi:hypothetical protein
LTPGSGDGSGARARTLAGFGVAFLGYTALTLLYFRDLLPAFSTAVPHDLGDPLLSAWVLWWNAHRLPFAGTWWDGLSFFPGPGSLAFSDHRVGLTLIAGPVQWLGGTPVLAYNVTLLSSFVLSAMAAHALAWLLTRSHGAGAVSGLIFGFNPFRTSHIAHLELLAAFWLPIALFALHRYVQRYEPRWLVLFTVCWWLQGLSSGYYLFYSAPVIALWAIWFARERLWQGVGAIALSCAVAVLALAPVLVGYRGIQNQLLLSRTFAEIESFSADFTGLLSATPNMALWRVPSLAANGEAEIYLGVVAPLLVLAAVFLRRGHASPEPGRRWRVFRVSVAAMTAAYALVAAGTLVGPWRLRIGPITLSASQTAQPFSIAVLGLILLGVSSPTFVAAFRRRSVLAFYLTAAVMTWAFTLGPRPKFLGHQLLYRGPYELLMLLPGFEDRLRVPARFVMMTILAVAVAAGLALVRLTGSGPRALRLGATVLILIALVADSWPSDLPMPAVPSFVRLPSGAPERAAVLELPLGNVGSDIAAVYRSIGHGRPVVNGYSGYAPPHYRVLATALGERDGSVLTTLATFAPIVVIIARADDPGGGLAGFVQRQPAVVSLQESDNHRFYLLPAARSADDAARVEQIGGPVPIRRISFNQGELEMTAVTDGNRETVWATPGPQHGDETVVVELDELRRVAGLSLSTGPALEGYPRMIDVSTSVDGAGWEQAWSGRMAGPALAATLKDARAAEAHITFAARPARWIRIRQLATHPSFAWFIAELNVYASAAPRS